MRRQDNSEEKLIDVSPYSTSTNYEWRAVASSSILIPVSVPTNISVSLQPIFKLFHSIFHSLKKMFPLKLAFIGYCGFSAEDAIALDNISVNVAIDPSGTTPVITSPPTQETTTTETTTQTVR